MLLYADAIKITSHLSNYLENINLYDHSRISMISDTNVYTISQSSSFKHGLFLF